MPAAVFECCIICKLQMHAFNNGSVAVNGSSAEFAEKLAGGKRVCKCIGIYVLKICAATIDGKSRNRLSLSSWCWCCRCCNSDSLYIPTGAVQTHAAPRGCATCSPCSSQTITLGRSRQSKSIDYVYLPIRYHHMFPYIVYNAVLCFRSTFFNWNLEDVCKKYISPKY